MGLFNKEEKDKPEDLFKRSWTDEEMNSFAIEYNKARTPCEFGKDKLAFDWHTFMVQQGVATQKDGHFSLKRDKLFEFEQLGIKVQFYKDWLYRDKDIKDVGNLGVEVKKLNEDKKVKNEEITAEEILEKF